MDRMIYNEPWKVELFELIQKAKIERKSLFTNSIATGPMWFSPNGLEDAHKQGRFIWGVCNWELADPREELSVAEDKVARAIAERDRIAAKMARY